MAIISFWSGDNKESGQTLSAAAVATLMALEHNYRVLLIDATFSDDTLERCFWKINAQKEITKLINKGKIDISSGAEGLVSAVASNKITPEIIGNYTRVVFNRTLDILCGLKTKIPEEFSKSLMLYKDLVSIADKYYDIVFIDLEKTLRYDTTRALLEASHLIVYNFNQNLRQMDGYLKNMEEHADILKRDKIIPLLSISDDNSKYNVKNSARYLREKELNEIPYNSVYKESASEAGVAQFFIKNGLSKASNNKNVMFANSVSKMIKTIDYKLEELKYKV